MSAESPEDLLFLYQDDLYILPESPATDIDSAGPSGKKVLALFPAGDLSPETRAMLDRMMVACGLGPDDYLLQGVDQVFQLPLLLKRYKPEKAVLFGLALQGEGWQVQRPLNQAFRFAGIRFLQAEPLSALVTSNEKKSALWQLGLKPLFDR